MGTRSRSSEAAPPASLKVADLKLVRLLADPLRLRLLEAFAGEPRTTKQVAEGLGLPPTRLYHHVLALERVGLLALRARRPKRGTIEKYYQAVARRVEVDSAAFGPRETRGPAALADNVLERTREDLRRLFDAPERAGAEVEPVVGRFVVRGTPAEIAAFQRRVRSLVRGCRTSGKGKGKGRGKGKSEAGAKAQRTAWALTVAFYPLEG